MNLNARVKQRVGLHTQKQESGVVLPCPSLRDALDDFEKDYIRSVLRLHRGRKGKAAETLGIDRKTLYLKMKKYRLLSMKAN
jgi:DNA-binding NtrC family response regulator